MTNLNDLIGKVISVDVPASRITYIGNLVDTNPLKLKNVLTVKTEEILNKSSIYKSSIKMMYNDKMNNDERVEISGEKIIHYWENY